MEQTRSRETRIRDQLDKTRITAPRDGLVVYATSVQPPYRGGSSAPLDAGQTVRERQELIYLPTADRMAAEVQIHESNMSKMRIGLPVIVSVDALQGKTYMGTVTKIALLPDAMSVWMNPDLKVYTTQITLDGNQPDLRTGMSCMAEIVVDQYEDAMYVPIQAIVRIAGQPTLFVKENDAFEPVPVETGMDNNRMIRILSGVSEGKSVLLTPPLKSADTPDRSKASNGDIASRLGASAANGIAAPADASAATAAAAAGTADSPPETRKRAETMTPEQREEMRKRMEALTPEQREEMRKRIGSRRRAAGADPAAQ
jgi:HlyD family secretion protein